MRAPRSISSRFPLLSVVIATSGAHAAPAWQPLLDAPEFTPGGGDLSVAVSARAEQSDDGAAVAGFVALALPLDRLAAPRRIAAKMGEDAREETRAESAPDAPPRPERESQRTEASERPALPAAILARLARDAVGAALRAHDAALRRSELEGLATRARLSAALPELRLRAVGSNDQSQRLTPTIDDPERYTISGGNDLLLEASATWKLNRLVFADEEIAVERLELEREKNTERLRERVVSRLFDWHRALSRLSGLDPGSNARGRFELERLEAEIELDVLTGGWFGEAARRLPLPRPNREAQRSEESTSSSETSSSSMSTLPTPSQ